MQSLKPLDCRRLDVAPVGAETSPRQTFVDDIKRCAPRPPHDLADRLLYGQILLRRTLIGPQVQIAHEADPGHLVDPKQGAAIGRLWDIEKGTRAEIGTD